MENVIVLKYHPKAVAARHKRWKEVEKAKEEPPDPLKSKPLPANVIKLPQFRKPKRR